MDLSSSLSSIEKIKIIIYIHTYIYILFNCSIYITTTRRTRASQAPAISNTDIQNDEALSSSSSIETIVAVENTDEELGSHEDHYQSDPEKLTFKLNKQEDKFTIYYSHVEFLNTCIDENLVPIGLKIEVEPSIGNHDETFLTVWNKKLKSYSIDLMKEIIKFCENTPSTTEQEKVKVDAPLHRETDTETYSDIKKAINTNTLQTKMACQKRKSRKLYSLKYGKPQSKSATAAAKNRKKKQKLESQKENYKSYADALKQSPDMASNHSRPMNFIDHLWKGQRPRTSHNQKDITTTEPGTIRILQHPKRKMDKPDPAPSVEPPATERIQNDNEKNEIAASIYYGGITEMLTALNQTTEAITGFERLLRSLSEQ